MKTNFNNSSLPEKVWAYGRLFAAEIVGAFGAAAKFVGAGDVDRKGDLAQRCFDVGHSLHMASIKMRGGYMVDSLPSISTALHRSVDAVDRMLQPDMKRRIGDFLIGGPRRAVQPE